jgi:translation initiation factor 1
MADLRDQLKHLFPDHAESNEPAEPDQDYPEFSAKDQTTPLICRFEKRKGKGTTIIEGFEGDSEALKALAKAIKQQFSVGGGIKEHSIILQGNFRDQIMDFLKQKGYKTKRVGG